MYLRLENQEAATIAAALRHYIDTGQGEPSNRTDAVHDLAVGEAHGECVSLDAEGAEGLLDRVLAYEDSDPNEGAAVCFACEWELPED